MTKKELAKLVNEKLDIMYLDAKCGLDYNSIFELIVAVSLSAQTTDVSVNKVTPTLFSKYKDALISQFIMENSKKTKEVKEDKDNIYSLFENEFGRPLTPFEIDTIRDWIDSGYSLEHVKAALGEAIRNKTRSIRYVDRVLLNYRQQEEIKKEGNTTLSEKWRKNIDETMNIAKTRWVKDDD